jgi:hypothetical protein
MSADHVSEYTWHNQMMTSVKKKLARAMSTSDVSKLRHSGRIASGVSPPRNVKSPEVPKDEGPKSLSVRRSKIHRELGQPLDPGEEHVPHEDPRQQDYVSKDTWRNQTMTSVKLIRHFRYMEITNPSDTWQLLGS